MGSLLVLIGRSQKEKLAFQEGHKMPLTEKGKKILAEMIKRYGKRKGEEVFYKMENSGKLTSITKKGKKK